jgi:hypothetical protein
MMVATAARVEYVGGKASAHATSAAGAASGEARANTICYCLSPFYKKNSCMWGCQPQRGSARGGSMAWRCGAPSGAATMWWLRVDVAEEDMPDQR